MLDQDGSSPAPRKAHQEVRTEGEEVVVPAVREGLDMGVGVVRALLGEEPGHQCRVDADLCCGNLGHRDRVALRGDVGGEGSRGAGGSPPSAVPGELPGGVR